MENEWDIRYSDFGFAYGMEPNVLFDKEIRLLKPATLLLAAEGEGRNAVFAATLGWDVFAYDQSAVARKHAMDWAHKNEVTLHYDFGGHEEINFQPAFFDAVALIYVHIDEKIRRSIHHKFMSYLKPGGKMILESFHQSQLGRNSGGPKSLNMLYDLNDLLEDFKNLEIIYAQTLEIDLEEGALHRGQAMVNRILAQKASS